jgi:dipeptidyl aminopeptidase/acylaminoacyl peptidase
MRNKSTHLVSLVLVLSVLLSACGGPQPQPARVDASASTPDPTATDTPSPVPATPTQTPTATATATSTPTPEPPNPLSIEYMRKQVYPGSDIVIEQTLAPGANYNQYIASYKSDGLKIYALLTVPMGQKPKTGWPVIVFNHGSIPPTQYRTTERYVAYVDAFARNGYIVFKSDYRGHGNSEGRAAGGYGSPDYTVDVLNAVSSIKRYRDADPNRIGMWGHSMGGSVTLRAMVVSQDIKAGVIWAGVVASYPDLFTKWHRLPSGSRPTLTPSSDSSRGWRNSLIAQYGTPEQNPQFWASISPNAYLGDLSGPIQLHHSTGDSEVPFEFSQTLSQQIKAAGKTVELYSYPGDDHNIANSFGIAMQRSIQFFDRYVKQVNVP